MADQCIILHAVDLSIHDAFKSLPYELSGSVLVISKAATVLPICSLDKISLEEFNYAMNLNFLQYSLFLNRVLANNFKNVSIVNISTGAAKKPIAGLSCYCASKSAMKMYLDCIQQEYSYTSINKIESELL